MLKNLLEKIALKDSQWLMRLQEMDDCLVLKQPYFLVSFPEARQQYKGFLWRLLARVLSTLSPLYVAEVVVIVVVAVKPLG